MNLCGLFNTKIIVEEHRLYYLTHTWGNKEVHAFESKSTFEFAYFDVAVHHFRFWATELPLGLLRSLLD